VRTPEGMAMKSQRVPRNEVMKMRVDDDRVLRAA